MEQTFCKTWHTLCPKSETRSKYTCSDSACLRNVSSKCASPTTFKRTHLSVSNTEFRPITRYGNTRTRVCCSRRGRRVCLCACSARRPRPHAFERSKRLAAESQGLRRQEIKHEMKTSSSLKILPSHFPISPLPLADLKMEAGPTGGGSGDWSEEAEFKQGGGELEWRLS